MLMIIKRQYKSSCLLVFFRIAALKNSEGSLGNANSGGLQVFRKTSFINIYYRSIFCTWQRNQITCEYFTLIGWKLLFLYYPSDLPAVANKIAHSRPKINDWWQRHIKWYSCLKIHDTNININIHKIIQHINIRLTLVDIWHFYIT